MKTVALYRTKSANRPHAPFPNAATWLDIQHKILDLLLVAAIGLGAAAIMLFLLALG